ncbi:MAG: T9SS type A sorting domain-containing protein [bacterium]|nr:T9SS type A sorting domain-containing protein [bacterium]
MKKNLLAFGLVIMGASLLAQTPRLSLYEEFTGETCPPCASTNPGLNIKLAANYNLIAAIKWQVPIPSAPSNTWSLYQTNKTEIDWRWRTTANGGYGYTPAINSAPSSKIDGQEATVFGASSGHPANLTNGVIATAQSYTSAFSITMQRDWNYNCSAITLTVNITASAPFSASAAGKLKFRCVMVERLIQFSVQPGTNGEKDFEDAAIKSFPTLQNGTAMADNWTIGQSMTFTMSCAIPSYTRKKSEIAFVGFIQDDGNQKIAQACRAAKAPLPPDGLSTLAANVNVTCSNAITPKITVNNTGANAITSIDVMPYIDGVAGALINWTGNIAIGTTTTISLGSVPAPTVAGAHTFSYNVVNMNSPVFNITGNSSKVSFLVVGSYQGTPVAEGYTSTVFPPTGWALSNADQGGATWNRNTLTGGYFQLPMMSAKYDFYSNSVVGDMDDFYLPPMDLSGTAAPDMTFDYAYCQRTTASNDKLDVLVSDNCGNTWTSVWSKSGAALATSAQSPLSNAPYLPNTSDFGDWQTALVNLSGYNKNNLLVKFQTTSDNGNNLYLDNVNLSQKSPLPNGISKNSNSAFNLNIYPNPANGTANLNITVATAGDSKVTVINTLGQIVFEKNSTLTAGSNAIAVDVKEFANGVYYVVVDTNTGSLTKKLTVSK